MKCPSCGYVKESKSEVVETVVRYKGGKRKGEIKNTEDKRVELQIGHQDFKEVSLLARMRKSCTSTGFEVEYDTMDILVCPECKTMIYNDVEIGEYYD